MNVVRFAPSRSDIDALAIDSDLFQGLEAVTYEPGTDHIDAPDLLFAELGKHVGSVGGEPLGAAKSRLEREPELFRLESELAGEQPPGLLAFAVVGIALVERFPRYAVKAHHQHVGPPVLHPVIAHVLR